MNLFPDQNQALDLATREPLLILTGGAGTGKSTTVSAILKKLDGTGIRPALAAPSGKAAKRLSEVTGYEAFTIHRLLEPKRVGNHFIFSRNQERPIDADLIVLDEVSMVDIQLMARFLDAVDQRTRLILVGDPYQLPSVGPGNVLKDLLDSKVVPSIELTIIKRQDEGLIVRNCHRIKNGEDIVVDNSNSKDFFFLAYEDESMIQTKIVELVTRRLPESKKLDPFRDIQVISPFREKTGLSCKPLNLILQEKLNANPPAENCRFKIGDKVIQCKNDYDLEILNGDIGYVVAINKEEKRIFVNFENPDRTVGIHLYENDLELAYCLTIHKSQGSEWPAVIIPIHKTFGGFMLSRNLLYTAVSRAKELCILVGQRSEIPKIVRRNNLGSRFSNLAQLIHVE